MSVKNKKNIQLWLNYNKKVKKLKPLVKIEFKINRLLIKYKKLRKENK